MLVMQEVAGSKHSRSMTELPCHEIIVSSLCKIWSNKTLVSSNGPRYVSDDFKTWCNSQGIQKKKESTIYHLIIGLAENKWGKIISQFLCVSTTSSYRFLLCTNPQHKKRSWPKKRYLLEIRQKKSKILNRFFSILGIFLIFF